MSKTTEKVLTIVSIVSLCVGAVCTLIHLFSRQKSKVIHNTAMTGIVLSNLCMIVSALAEPKAEEEELA